MFNIYQFKLQSYCSFKCFMRTGGYGGPVGFLVKKYTCPVIFLGCPGRPGLVFVGPCIWKVYYLIDNAGKFKSI